MRFLSIDPGKLGGIAIIDDSNTESKDQLQLIEIPKIGNEIDVKELYNILKEFVDRGPDHIIGLEDVHSIFGASAASNFSFGETVGLKKGMLIAIQSRHVLVQPKKWQKTMWEGTRIQTKVGKNDTKATSLLAATKWFPNTKFLKSKDGLYDAALIAMYLKINYNLEK